MTIYKNLPALLSLILISISPPLFATDNQKYIDFYRSYFELRTNIISAELAKKLRADLVPNKLDLHADLTPLEKYYPKGSWEGLIECYENRSCRGYMLLTIRDWSLKEFNVIDFEHHPTWVNMYYTGIQMDGEKGHGYVSILKTDDGLKLSTRCWKIGKYMTQEDKCK